MGTHFQADGVRKMQQNAANFPSDVLRKLVGIMSKFNVRTPPGESTSGRVHLHVE